ncbi:PilN domain-containing protein [Calothrix rhizosoleniae]|uniref:PilN domain-containing protein n=1 Tax=Calothrix rhizosoleniae TaxID=888997 RepID=UPI000B49D176|nr:PilN domain-containing protein [Calothrix rhizosoleniae]
MYSLDINFLQDRPDFQKNSPRQKSQKSLLPEGDLTLVYAGLAIGICIPALVGGSLWFLQAKNTDLEQKLAQLEQENKKLDTEIGNINKIKRQTKAIQAETQALVSVFDQIRPWSAMLQDLRDRIPAAVQIENINQIPPEPAVKGKPAPNPAGGIRIVGKARSFNDVNDFLLTLQKSSFLKSEGTKIINAILVKGTKPKYSNGEQVGIATPDLVKYTIQSTMSDIPASELIRELEQKGTVGLVARIRNLQQTGVLKK